jgi:hypothetical protein
MYELKLHFASTEYGLRRLTPPRIFHYDTFEAVQRHIQRLHKLGLRKRHFEVWVRNPDTARARVSQRKTPYHHSEE